MSASLDTIAARATPPGRGGVAIVRVSGPDVVKVMRAILHKNISARNASYLPFYDVDNQIIDQGIAIYFPGPNSFTGEDVIEFHGHGGPVVVDNLLQTLLQQNVRLARPGEFSERAFLNDKLDLAQAEAIADLINASSKQAARSAIRSLQGEFSKIIHEINERIIYLRMYVEAAIDFIDEEIDFMSNDKVLQKLQSVMKDLSLLQSKAKQGSLLSEGITAVIVGEPNVGKSSLLNCLSQKEVAIVTDIPGTTRDLLHNTILIDGMPMVVIDTAGLRQSSDPVEQEGIRRAYLEMEKADLVFYVTDASRHSKIDLNLIPEPVRKNSVVMIRNKIDLVGESASVADGVINLSVKDAQGIDLLKTFIKQEVGFQGDTEDLFIARRRHLDAIARASALLVKAYDQLTQHGLPELAAEDLRLAQLALAEITGEFSADDLLGKIFSSFCIGK